MKGNIERDSAMRVSDYDRWNRHSDAVGKAKSVGGYRIELYYGTDRGGMINVWEKGDSELDHIFSPSDDRTHHQADEIHFMHYQNAIDEYQQLKNKSAVIDLMWRNM